MIDISQHRSRIGTFYQISRNKSIKFRKYDQVSVLSEHGHVRFLVVKSLLKIFLMLGLLTTTLPPSPCTVPPPSPISSPTYPASRSCSLPRLSSPLMVPATACHKIGKKLTPNFLAKYLHGNIKKGILNLHLNIRSLNNKVGEVKKLIKDHSPHILGLSECELRKVNDEYDESKLKIPGYLVLFPKSWYQQGSARVLVYVKKSLEFERIEDLEEPKVQSIWIKAGFKGAKRIYFCHGYREHTTSLGNSLSSQRSILERFLNQWEMACDHSSPSEPNEVHISCDMNLDCLDGRWLQSGYHLLSLARLVQSSCNSHNFSQLVKGPTRLQYNATQNKTEVSCIDHVYTNTRHRCSSVTVTPFGDSDHDMIGYTRFSKDPPAAAATIRKRSYKIFKKQDYLKDLSEIDWTDVLCSQDLDLATEIFTRKLRYVLDIHAPWVKFQKRKFFIPWLTKETKQLIVERDKLKEVAKNLALRDTGENVSEEQKKAWNRFKILRNRVTKNKRKDEINYKSQKISEVSNTPEKVWKTAKAFMGWKSTGTPNQLEVDGKLEGKASNIAKIMNNYFIDKVVTIRNQLKRVPANLSECWKIMEGKQCKLGLNYVSVESVKKLLKNLKNSKSTGVDGLDSYSVKLGADIIARPLHHIITLSLMQNKFPKGWKYTKLIPLHKKQSRLERKNYRPVALLSPLSKILEKVVYLQLYNYLSSNKIFHPNLHGYRHGRSTQTALLQMYDRWVRAAAAGQVSGVILIDLSAAFDLVDSELLLKKLKIYGLDNDLLTWIQSYLSDRHQAVWIDHTYSEFKSHSIGVPQGSILGPLFFLIYYNDLISSLDCEVDAYADDSTMSTSGTVAEISSRLTENCQKIVNWMSANFFKLNADKTHILTVGTGERLSRLRDKVKVTMDGVLLKENLERCELLLGCYLESNLKWNVQISVLLKKLKSRIVGLTSLKYIVPYQTRNTITMGMFNSILVYCLPLYGGCTVAQLHSIQVLQNKATQVVTHLPPRTHRSDLYDRVKWLTVNQLVTYHTLISVFKIRKNEEPEYLAKYLKSDNRLGRIIIPNTNLGLARKSFVWRGSVAWNSLPQQLRNCTRIGAFKSGVRQWVTSNIPRFLD